MVSGLINLTEIIEQIEFFNIEILLLLILFLTTKLFCENIHRKN